MMEIYTLVQPYVFGVLLVMVLTWVLVRAMILFYDFAMGNDVDRFDNSCVFDDFNFSLGTHPLGILIDGVISFLAAGLASWLWPVVVPCIALFGLASALRYNNYRKRRVMERLRGEGLETE